MAILRIRCVRITLLRCRDAAVELIGEGLSIFVVVV